MVMRPIPGPWRLPPPLRPRYVTSADEVTYTASCDCGSGLDATWTKTRDATRPTCVCTCHPEEGAA